MFVSLILDASTAREGYHFALGWQGDGDTARRPSYKLISYHRLVPNHLRTPTIAYRPQGPLLPRSAMPR